MRCHFRRLRASFKTDALFFASSLLQKIFLLYFAQKERETEREISILTGPCMWFVMVIYSALRFRIHKMSIDFKQKVWFEAICFISRKRILPTYRTYLRLQSRQSCNKSIWATNKLINGKKELQVPVRYGNLFEYHGNHAIRWKSHWASTRLSRKCFNEFLPWWRTREVVHPVVSQSLFFPPPSLLSFLCSSSPLALGSYHFFHRILPPANFFRDLYGNSFRRTEKLWRNSLGCRNVSNVLEPVERELNMGISNAVGGLFRFRG